MTHNTTQSYYRHIPMIYMWHVSRDVTHSYDCHIRVIHLWQVSRIDKTIGLFCKRDLQKRRYSAKEHSWHETIVRSPHSYDLYVTWHSYDRHLTLIWSMSDMTHSYARHDSFVNVTPLTHAHDVTHLYEWHDSFTWVTDKYEYVTRLSWHDTFVWLPYSCDPSVTS